MVERCETCKFSKWVNTDYPYSCYRYPPQYVFNPDFEKTYTVFPGVYGDWWCGEYKAKEG